jgi:hypothetical protein
MTKTEPTKKLEMTGNDRKADFMTEKKTEQIKVVAKKILVIVHTLSITLFFHF